jgi:uncharacterized membrane protein YidH (DUF202 family)
MSHAGTPPYDPGLQPERTALAWRRTALAMMLGPVAAARVLAPDLGALAALAALAGLAVGVFIGVVSAKRHRDVFRVLSSTGDPRELPGAALLLVTAAAPVVCGIVVGGFLVERL